MTHKYFFPQPAGAIFQPLFYVRIGNRSPIARGEDKANIACYALPVEEGRKRVLLIAASILAARKICQLDSTRPSPALNSAIHDAVILAKRIMDKIDELCRV